VDNKSEKDKFGAGYMSQLPSKFPVYLRVKRAGVNSNPPLEDKRFQVRFLVGGHRKIKDQNRINLGV
jgi:hypothetical protein